MTLQIFQILFPGKFRCILCDFNGIPVTFIHDDLADRTSENLWQECQYILHLTVQCLRPVAKDRHPAGKQPGQYHVLQI